MALHAETNDLATTEFRKTLDTISVTQRHAARLFNVTSRHIRRWRDGSRRTPRGALIVLRLLAMQAVTIEEIERAVARIDSNGNPGPLAAPEQSVPARAPAAALAILALGPASCRWPCGDPEDQGFRFCGGPVVAPPYCEFHRRAAYLAPRPQQAPVDGPSRFGYGLPAARQVRTATRVPTLPPVCTQPPDLGTTSSQRSR